MYGWGFDLFKMPFWVLIFLIYSNAKIRYDWGLILLKMSK